MKKRLLLLFLIFVSCTNEQKPVKNKRSDIMQSLRLKAINTGSDSAYGTYIDFATQERDYYDLLSLSLIMQHKYQNEKSYYQIYKAMVEIKSGVTYRPQDIEYLNEADRIYAIYYLTKGAQKGLIECQSTLEKIYRNGYGHKIDTQKSDSLYKILESEESIGHFYRKNRENKKNVDEIY